MKMELKIDICQFEDADRNGDVTKAVSSVWFLNKCIINSRYLESFSDGKGL
jgi:hypothetical protein